MITARTRSAHTGHIWPLRRLIWVLVAVIVILTALRRRPDASAHLGRQHVGGTATPSIHYPAGETKREKAGHHSADRSVETERIRPLEHSITVVLGVIVILTAGGLAVHWSVERIWFLVIGVSLLAAAWMVGRYGVIGYEHYEGLDTETMEIRPPTTKVTYSPLPKGVLASLLFLIGVAFVLAGTPTGIGGVLAVPARGAVVVGEFAKTASEFVTPALIVVGAPVALFYGLARRDRNALNASAFLAALIVLGVCLNYLYYLLDPDAWQKVWDSELAPLKAVIGLLS